MEVYANGLPLLDIKQKKKHYITNLKTGNKVLKN